MSVSFSVSLSIHEGLDVWDALVFINSFVMKCDVHTQVYDLIACKLGGGVTGETCPTLPKVTEMIQNIFASEWETCPF